MRVWDQLDDYQRDAVEFVKGARHAALLFEQGTGKTWITGGILEQLIHSKFLALGVVRLSNIDSTWVTFLTEQVGITVCRSLGEVKSAVGPRILLIHYEALPAIRKAVRKMRWSFMFYDESQGLKNRASKASRIAGQLSDSAERRLILSGTPMDKRPMDLWAQFRFVAPHVFGTRWKDFEDEYLKPVEIDMTGVRPGSHRWNRLQRALTIRRNKREMRKDKFPQFLDAMKPHALRLTKSVLNLPPLEYVPECVELWGSQRRLYEEIERDLVSTTLRLTAPLKVTQIGKLQQITGGYVVDDDGVTHAIGSAKMRRVKSLVKEHREPLVIFAKYLAEVEGIAALCNALGRRTAMIRGKDKKRRGEIVKQFQSGGLDVIVCQIRTGGVGIDLFRARRAIIYSSTHSWIDFDQAISRIHRRGQKQHVYIHKIIVRSSIDEAIDMALRVKGKTTKFVLDHLRRKHDERQERSPVLQVRRRLAGRGPRRPGNHRSRHAA